MNEELKVLISVEIDNLKKGVENAKKQVENYRNQVKKASKNIEDSFKKMGQGITKALKVVGGALAGALTGLIGLSAATEEYRRNQGKLTTAFEAAGSSAAQASKTYNDLYRVLGDSGQATEAAAHLAKLTTEEKALAEWGTIATGVYATFGESLPIESLTEAANETAKTGTLTGALADAINWAGVSEEKFQKKLEACNTEAEREQLIRQVLNGLYTDAALKYEENNASLLAYNKAQAKMAEASARVGEALQPVMTALTNLGADILTALAPYIEKFSAKYLPAITEALAGVGDKIGVVINWITNNWELISTIGTIILGVVSTLYVLSSSISAVSTVLSIATSPISLVVLGITTLISVIVLCIKHWDEIKAKVIEVWGIMVSWITEKAEAIKDTVVEAWGTMVGWITEKSEAIKANVIEAWGIMVSWISDKAEAIKETVSGMVQSVSLFFNSMKENGKRAVSELKEDATNTLENMKTAFEENGGGMKGAMVAAMEGIKGCFSTGYNFINNLTGGKLGEIVSKISSKLSSARNTVDTILTNIKDKFSSIFESAKSIVSNAISAIKDIFNFEWSLPKLKMPHFKVVGQLDLFKLPPSIPTLSVEWYAKGGVFDRPTLFNYGNGSIGGLGEAGAEAVVPLERNTEWLDKIADKLAAKQGNTPIVLEVDGKVFAQTCFTSINQYARQTGKLPINIY